MAGPSESRPGEQGSAGRPVSGQLRPGEQAPALAAVTAPDEPPRPGARLIIALAGLREPIIVILFLIAFFTSISGKPLDGLLLFIVATGLAWDAAARYRARITTEAGAVARPGAAGPSAAGTAGTAGIGASRGEATPAAPAGPAAAGPAMAGEPAAPPGSPGATLARQPPGTARIGRNWLLVACGLAGAACYAVIVGSFIRYSWPATVGVIGLGATVVALGWRGPLRRRPDTGPLPLPGAVLWGAVLVAGGLWELVSLLLQPDLTTSSYAHPTISALTDPLLGSHAGRSVALGIWLAIGWFLAGR